LAKIPTEDPWLVLKEATVPSESVYVQVAALVLQTRVSGPPFVGAYVDPEAVKPSLDPPTLTISVEVDPVGAVLIVAVKLSPYGILNPEPALDIPLPGCPADMPGSETEKFPPIRSTPFGSIAVMVGGVRPADWAKTLGAMRKFSPPAITTTDRHRALSIAIGDAELNAIFLKIEEAGIKAAAGAIVLIAICNALRNPGMSPPKVEPLTV